MRRPLLTILCALVLVGAATASPLGGKGRPATAPGPTVTISAVFGPGAAVQVQASGTPMTGQGAMAFAGNGWSVVVTSGSVMGNLVVLNGIARTANSYISWQLVANTTLGTVSVNGFGGFGATGKGFIVVTP